MRNTFVVVLRFIRALVFPALLVFSIMFNLALLLSTSLLGLASAGLELLTGYRSPVLQQADDLVKVKADLDEERFAQRELRSELVETQADLSRERRTNREFKSKLAEKSAELAAAKGAQREVREKVSDTASAVARRAAKTATREVAAMPGEALPLVGTAVIIGATALELADLCQTIKDMTALQNALDSDYSAPEEQLTVCELEVPSRKELMQMAAHAPEKAWNAATELMPDIASAEIPEINWSDAGEWLTEKIGGATESLSDAGRGAGTWFSRWWNEGD